MSLSSLERLERLNKIFSNDERPLLPDTSMPHIVDQDLAGEDLESTKPNVSPDMKTTDSCNIICKPEKCNPPFQKYKCPLDDTGADLGSEEDDYIAAFRTKVKPVLNAKYRPRTRTDRAISASLRSLDLVPKRDSYGNPLAGHFCQLSLVAKFPYKYINDEARELVANDFFNDGKIWSRYAWEIYCLRVPSDMDHKPLILTPAAQVQNLLDQINQRYDGSLDIPADPRVGFLLSFYQDGTPLPRRLGVARNRASLDDMEASVPPASPGYGKPPAGSSRTVNLSYAAWRLKIETAIDANRRKNKAIKKKKHGERLLQQQDWRRSMCRAQRYLGLRRTVKDPPEILPGMSWAEEQAIREQTDSSLGKAVLPLDPTKAAPYDFDEETVIICIDFETNERNHAEITEIGISTLDTLDLKGTAPGSHAENWSKCIRSRHIRVAEFAHITNLQFCAGAPDKFQFGQSEFVKLEDAAATVDSCFKWPFSAGYEHDGTLKQNVSELPSGNQLGDPVSGSHPEPGEAASEQNIATSEISGAPAETNPEHNHGPSNVDQSAANEAAVQNILVGSADLVRALSHDTQLAAEETAKTGTSATSSAEREISTHQDDKGEGSPSPPQSPHAKDSAPTHAEAKSRKIVLLFHDANADLSYLRSLKSALFDQSSEIYSSVLEVLDTAILYRVYARESETRALKYLLMQMGLTGWYLHCGGNDARYTLECFLALAVAARIKEDKEDGLVGPEEKTQAEQAWKDEQERRVKDKVMEAEEQARFEGNGWDLIQPRKTLPIRSRGTSDGPRAHADDEKQKDTADPPPPPDPDENAPPSIVLSAADLDGGEPHSWASQAERTPEFGQARKKVSGEARKRAEEMWVRDAYKGSKERVGGVERFEPEPADTPW